MSVLLEATTVTPEMEDVLIQWEAFVVPATLAIG